MTCQSLNPENPEYKFHTHPSDIDLEPSVTAPTYDFATMPSVDVADGGNTSGKPVYSLDQIADQLTTGYWQSNYSNSRAFDLGANREITVNLTGLTNDGKFLARAALEAWEDVSGINFKEVTSSSAQMRFDDDRSGAFSNTVHSGGEIIYSTVNVSTQWLASYGTSLTSYNYQTYIHEIGHALGLGHAGNYNGGASYASDAHYANDSWQASIMSYFSETANSFVDASFSYVISPQMADILAIQNLYGDASSARSGNTTYGTNATADANVNILSTQAATIYDGGGIDTINLSSKSNNQRLDLNAETFSDINGKTGNLAIARGTVIENAITGSGNDAIKGNSANNNIQSGAGNDTIIAGGGNDTINGGAGSDLIDGGTGNDTVVLSGSLTSYDVLYDYSTYTGANLRIRDASGSIDTLENVEYLKVGGTSYSVSALVSSLVSSFGAVSSGAGAQVAALETYINGGGSGGGGTGGTGGGGTGGGGTGGGSSSSADMTLTVNQMETGEYGNNFNGKSDADGIITAEFVSNNTDLTLNFGGYDVDRADEVQVFINGVSLGFLSKGINNGVKGYSFDIPAAMQTSGTNTITFKQEISTKWGWGVTDVELVPTTGGVSTNADMALTLNQTETGEYGNHYNGNMDADGEVTASFTGTNDDLRLLLSAYDIDRDTEVQVYVNGTSVGFLARGSNNLEVDYIIDIPAALQNSGTNIITFKQEISTKWKWGVTDLTLVPASSAAAADVALAPEVLVEGKFGNINAQVTDADGVVTAVFDGTGQNMTLDFSAYDIDFDNEVEVFVNGQSVGMLDAGADNGYSDYQIAITAGMQVPGQNTITFVQSINANWKWGVKDLQLSIDAGGSGGSGGFSNADLDTVAASVAADIIENASSATAPIGTDEMDWALQHPTASELLEVVGVETEAGLF